jgi:hypothetical protein
VEVLFFLLLFVFGVALAAAIGTYYVSHNQLVKARHPNPEILSLLLSLCSFAIVMATVYFIFLDRVLMRL